MTMPCWRDKMPDGSPVMCGNFQSWEDFLKWDGEKFCHARCPPGPRGKQSQSASYRRSSKAWMRSLPMGKDIRGRFEDKPIYQKRVYGRRVA
jgi:hypothetical protein